MATYCHPVQFQRILGLSWTGRLLFITTFHHALCAKNSPPELRCWGDLQDLDGVQMPKHCASLLFPWSTLPLSTAHQFGVVVRILASLTALSMMLCALPLDACVHTNGGLAYFRRYPASWAPPIRSDTFLGESCYPWSRPCTAQTVVWAAGCASGET